jgi:hypothetical protein
MATKVTNTGELREFLLERMVKLASGEETLAVSLAAAQLAKQVNATLGLELQAARLIASGLGGPKVLSIK